jgi:lysophospholipase L1-like esterase
VKPTKIALFIVLILGGLLSLAFFFPKEGIKIGEDFVLHFPTIDELLESSEKNVVDISEIIEKNQVPEDSLDTEEQNLTAVVMEDSSIIYYEPVEINPNDVTRKLEFPDKKRNILYPFFKELSKVKSNGKLIRVLHYGDSQIEADRITSYLRYKLQGQFGGSGPGLIPAMQPYGFKSPVLLDNSEGWIRYPGFGKRDSTVKHRRYGVLASFSRFAPYLDENKSDSISAGSDTLKNSRVEYNEWLQVEHSPYSTRRVKKYSQCRMFYGYNKYPVNFKIFAEGKELDKKILLPSENLQVKKWAFGKTPEYLRMEFNGYDSPDIFALALDGKSGVAVDNIGLRGSTGTVFSNSDQTLLKAIYQNLDVKLIIMQFGGNAAPTMKEDYNGYKNGFYRQLITLKRLIPGVSIIVIGIADMSQKEKDQYISYPNVSIIRDALKEATFKANCAYWDTFEAMGGENSMPSWVFSDPPLAEKDFVHFTVKGSRIIAQMFYKALMLEYNNYFNTNIKKKTASK